MTLIYGSQHMTHHICVVYRITDIWHTYMGFIQVIYNAHIWVHLNTYIYVRAYMNAHIWGGHMSPHIWLHTYDESYMSGHIWGHIYDDSYMNTHILVFLGWWYIHIYQYLYVYTYICTKFSPYMGTLISHMCVSISSYMCIHIWLHIYESYNPHIHAPKKGVKNTHMIALIARICLSSKTHIRDLYDPMCTHMTTRIWSTCSYMRLIYEYSDIWHSYMSRFSHEM
jgi:hypothetical protein